MEFKDIGSEKSMIYFMSVWAISYAELTNEDAYLPVCADPEALCARVRQSESYPCDLFAALTEILEQDHPDIDFNFGLGPADLIENARHTQALLMLSRLRDLAADIDGLVTVADRELQHPVLAELTMTPVRLGSFLRAHLRYIEPVDPEFHLGGTNGQLTILKLAANISSFKAFARNLAKNVGRRLQVEGMRIVTPQAKQALLPNRRTNEAMLFSLISLALAHRSLAVTLGEHVGRNILVPGDPDRASHCLRKALKLFDRSAACLNLSAASGETCLDGFVFLHDALGCLYEILEISCYDQRRVLDEFNKNPSSLHELVTYYAITEENSRTGHVRLRGAENFTLDFRSAVKRMKHWDVF